MERETVQDGARSPLARRLLEPAETVALADLPGRWFHQRVELLVAGAGAEAADPALVGRVRGAWGRALMRGASAEALAGDACPWDPPCALDVLFGDHGMLTPRLPLPRPYVIEATAVGADLGLGLTLFGLACDWADGAAEALTAAVRHGAPCPLRHHAPVIAGRRLSTFERVAVPDAAGLATLTFRTPVQFRSGSETRQPSARTLISGLGNRLTGLARWQDARVDGPWLELAEAAEALAYQDDLTPAAWTRHSGRQDNRRILVEGLAGRITLAGDLAPFLPLLALGATAHVGGRASLGLGGYDVSFA